MIEPLSPYVLRTCIGCFKEKVRVRTGTRAYGNELRCEKCKKGSRRGPVDKQAEADRKERAEYAHTWGR